MPDTSHPQQPPTPDARPDRSSATDPAPPQGSSGGDAPTKTPKDDARTPDEYMEEPGRHRRGDGAATDVGA
jgi:hypothetical protein